MKSINIADGEMEMKQSYCKSYFVLKNIVLAIVSHDYNARMYDVKVSKMKFASDGGQ